MSFSQRTREELLVQDIKAPTAKIELMAAFKAIGTLQIDFNSVMIEIKTSQIKLTKRILEILKHDYPEANTQTLVRNVRSFNVDKKSYLIRITTHAKEILFDLGLISDVNANFILSLNDVRDKLVTDEDKRVYARMFFCCTGSVNDPKNAQQYHLEIYNSNKEYLEEIQSLTKDYAINFKITR